MRVFLDANILFSASATSSPTSRLTAAILACGVAVINAHVREEARRNLALKRPHQLGECDRLCARMELTTAFYTGALPPLPDEDKPVLASAVAAHCTHLWTSDRRHFGALYGTAVHGVQIVTSVQLASQLIARGWHP
jgi:hypothetical protein